MKLKDFTPDTNNANLGTAKGQKMIIDSIQNNKLGRSIVVDKNNKIIGGNKTLEAVAEVAGVEAEVRVIETNGEMLIVHKRSDLDLDDPDPNNPARRLAYQDNLSSHFSLQFDPAVVLADIDLGFNFEAINVTAPDLADLFKDYEQEVFDPKPKKPNPRKYPLDLIYTAGTIGKTALDSPSTTLVHCCIACRSGFMYGVQSSGSGGVCVTATHQDAHKLEFIDNDYFNYDHGTHLAAVKLWEPKYCTVVDVMTKEQCLKDGIKYYPLEQVLDFAEELQQYATNVIVIPKYDCLDQIPEKYVLGYSVPTSHGGTPLPAHAFKGRRVHLLGGSWKKQLAFLAELGDDVVSIDNNYILLKSKFGQFTNSEGENVSLTDQGIGDITNVQYVSIALSLGYIGAKVNQLFPTERETNDI